jgi:hypothetical protein
VQLDRVGGDAEGGRRSVQLIRQDRKAPMTTGRKKSRKVTEEKTTPGV